MVILRTHHCMNICDLQTIKPTLIKGLVAQEMPNLIRFPIDSKNFDPPWIRKLNLNFELGLFVKWGLWGWFQVWSKVCWYQLGFFSLSGFHSAWLWVQYLMSDKYQFMWKCNLDRKLCDFNIHSPFLFLALKVFHFSPFERRIRLSVLAKA